MATKSAPRFPIVGRVQYIEQSKRRHIVQDMVSYQINPTEEEGENRISVHCVFALVWEMLYIEGDTHAIWAHSASGKTS